MFSPTLSQSGSPTPMKAAQPQPRPMLSKHFLFSCAVGTGMGEDSMHCTCESRQDKPMQSSRSQELSPSRKPVAVTGAALSGPNASMAL